MKTNDCWASVEGWRTMGYEVPDVAEAGLHSSAGVRYYHFSEMGIKEPIEVPKVSTILLSPGVVEQLVARHGWRRLPTTRDLTLQGERALARLQAEGPPKKWVRVKEGKEGLMFHPGQVCEVLEESSMTLNRGAYRLKPTAYKNAWREGAWFARDRFEVVDESAIAPRTKRILAWLDSETSKPTYHKRIARPAPKAPPLDPSAVRDAEHQPKALPSRTPFDPFGPEFIVKRSTPAQPALAEHPLQRLLALLFERNGGAR